VCARVESIVLFFPSAAQVKTPIDLIRLTEDETIFYHRSMRNSDGKTILLRDVVERAQNDEICTQTVKMADSKRDRPLGALRRYKTEFSVTSTSAGSISSRNNAIGEADLQEDAFEMQNTLMVQSMSSVQIQAALSEIESSFSERSIEFLRKRGALDLDNKTSTNIAQDSGSLHAEEISVSMSDNDTQYPDWAVPEYRPTDLRALPSALAASAPDRFDLEGRKFIDSDSFVGYCMKVLSEDEYIKQIIDSDVTILIEAFCRDLYSGAEHCGIIRPVSSAAARNSYGYDPVSPLTAVPILDNELFHHEYEQERPGYTLHEATEVN
jgi:hypothetical protein